MCLLTPERTESSELIAMMVVVVVFGRLVRVGLGQGAVTLDWLLTARDEIRN